MANNQSGSGSGGSSGEQKKKQAEGFKEMILSSMKSRSGKETTAWIQNLTSEGMQEIEDAARAATSAPPSTALPAQFAHPSVAQTQVKWVDRLFDLLQQYEVEFNRAIQIPELRVVTERAVITPELFARLQSNDQYHYSGRLHTSYWTLAVRGNLSHIEAYIIPSDHFIGFEKNISNYTRFFEFIPVWDGELKWSSEKGIIGYGQLPSMVKLIFGQLIKVAKGDADSQEPFSYGISSPQLPAKPTGGPALQSSGTGSSGEAASTDYLRSHNGVFEDDKPVQGEEPVQDTSRSGKQGSAAHFLSAKSAGKGSNEDVDADADSSAGVSEKELACEDSAAAAAAAESSGAVGGAAAAATAESSGINAKAGAGCGEIRSGSSGPGSDASLTAGADASECADFVGISAACEVLIKAVGMELDALSKAGGRAFEKHDFALVEKLMKRTSKLKNMRESMIATIKLWKQMLRED